MHTSKKPLYSLALGLLLLGAACGKKDTNTNTSQTNTENEIEDVNDDSVNASSDDNENINSDDDTDDDSNSNRNAYTNSSDDDVNVNADDDSDDDSNTNSNDDAVSGGSLKVEKPEANDELESPFEVKGTSSAATVTVRVKSANGNTLFTVPVTVRNGEWRVDLTFEVTTTSAGTVEVYETGVAGAETNLVRVPITFKVESDDDTNNNTNE